MSDVTEAEDQSYELSVRVLGNELLGVRLSTTSTSSRWIAVAVITIFSSLVLLGAYGEKIVNLYQWAVN